MFMAYDTMSFELCCVKGCHTNVSKDEDVILYSFPDRDIERELRSRWIDAVQIANSEKRSWEPLDTSRLCSEHFVANRRSHDPTDASYVPTIFPAKSVPNGYELLIDVDDSEFESDGCDSEVIEETSDCLFVVGKIKQEAVDKEDFETLETRTPKTINESKISRVSSKKKRISRRANGAGSPKRSKITSPTIGKKLSRDIASSLFTGKFSSDSSDSDFNANELKDLLYDDEDEVSERELTVSDKLKVALKSPPRPHHDQVDSEEFYLSDVDIRQKKRSRTKKRKKTARFIARGSQAALPGVCDGFVFCTTRDDDFNVGVQCNIFYEFKLVLPEVDEVSSVIDEPSALERTVQS
ncbi:hypothetical protein GE061_012379 [Apolygus lucorum]|uniref:THAP-type domain-containing protein n=1 Tax=Apolygus lucorum TaxID=248454 RepID=A0A8S9XSD2_APOLU|nr:hypothetical protein GE061_012379 [Apolygus lucorum]